MIANALAWLWGRYVDQLWPWRPYPTPQGTHVETDAVRTIQTHVDVRVNGGWTELQQWEARALARGLESAFRAMYENPRAYSGDIRVRMLGDVVIGRVSAERLVQQIRKALEQ